MPCWSTQRTELTSLEVGQLDKDMLMEALKEMGFRAYIQAGGTLVFNGVEEETGRQFSGSYQGKKLVTVGRPGEALAVPVVMKFYGAEKAKAEMKKFVSAGWKITKASKKARVAQ